MPETGTAVALKPGEGVAVGSPLGGSVTFKVRAPESGGTMTVFEVAVPPGEGPPLHLHRNEDEVLYVLEGELDLRVGSDVHRAPAGMFVFIPRGVPHTFRNVTGDEARALAVFTPSGMERFFERVAVEAPGPGDLAIFAAIAGDVGMEVVGPPLGSGDAAGA